MTQAPTPGPLSVEINYEVYQDGDFCASSTRLQDAEHYANLYGQDGPVKCQTVVSVRHDDFLLPGDARLTPTAPVEASGSERALQDAVDFGVGFLVDGQRVSPERVTVCHGDNSPLRPQPSGEQK